MAAGKRSRNPEKRVRKAATRSALSHEALFRQRVAVAARARAEYDRRLLSAADEHLLDRLDLPEYLLVELSYQADLEYSSAVHLLQHPRLSFGAEMHLRGLLEFVAYVSFVLGKETDLPVGTARQRAVCLSVARARMGCNLMAEACAEGKVAVKLVLTAFERVEKYEELHATEGCPFIEDKARWPCEDEQGRPCHHRQQWPCRHSKRPHPYNMVPGILDVLGKRLGTVWLHDLYKTSSQRIHQGLTDRIVSASADGVGLPGGPARFNLRAGFLQAAIELYGLGLGWILETYSAPEAAELGRWFKATHDHPDLAAAFSGRFDS
jgi:hypothetical protein